MATPLLSLLAPLALAPAPVAPSTAPQAALEMTASGVDEAEIKKRLADAGDDVRKLWDVQLWLRSEGLEDQARGVLERILEVDEDHEEAHRALSHHSYDGKWFETYSALSAYRRAEEKRMAEKGLVRYGSDWAPEADVPYLRMGWVRDASGEWVDQRALDAAAHDERMREQGYQQQDLTWVHPDEFDKWREGLWKCGEEWKTTEEANAYHSSLATWWEFPSKQFVIASTCARETVQWAGWHADQTATDLVRAFGIKPERPPIVVTLSSLQQYNDFAAGDQAAGRSPADVEGFSSLHYAFFADAWFDTSASPPTFEGAGICYWDTQDPNLSPFGLHAVRHAAAQSWLEAIDPSWNTVSLTVAGQQPLDANAFWAEKRIPRWLRYGAASYVERYFEDRNAGDEGNPMWAREWAIENLRRQGGLRGVEDVIAFELSLGDVEGSTKLIHEAGLLVAFILDGDCAPVREAHQAFKADFRAGKDTTESARALGEALVKNQKALRRFAKL